MHVSRTVAPDVAEVEAALAASRRARAELVLQLQVVTPVLGGGYRARELDDVDVARAPSIRGQLRFWWRALYGCRYESPSALYEKEAELWGGTAGGRVHRSRVSVLVEDPTRGIIDSSEIDPRGAYALWVAKKPRRTGDKFKLRVHVDEARGCARNYLSEVQHTLCYWILFGGIGARTRRGLGALEPTDETAERLGLASLDWGRELEHPPVRRSFPTLQGAQVYLDPKASKGPREAWHTALEWLRRFRQVDHRSPGQGRPGRTSWPEADVVRSATGNVAAHPPRYAGSPVFPRAQFGLPIPFQWQRMDRNQKPYPSSEPANFSLKPIGHERWASALIVKPVWSRQGWNACALWLSRAWPAWQVQATAKGERLPRAHVEAMPDGPSAPSFLSKYGTVQEAFFAHLNKRGGQ